MVKPSYIGSFSGCGGSSLGYKWAGFDIRAAVEIDEAASLIYEANHSTTKLARADIRSLESDALLEIAGVRRGELCIWEGSPPCSKFSMAGQRQKAWNKVTQTDSSDVKLRNVEDLFFDWIRLLREMRPYTAVAENVPGLASGVAKGKLVQFVQAIRDAGYVAQVWILPAERFGVPQARHRLFIACVRNDLDAVALVKPIPTTDPVAYWPHIEALPTVLWEDWKTQSVPPSEHHAPSIRGCKIEHYWNETEVGGAHPKRFGLKKPDPQKPSFTFLAFDGNIGTGGLCHPYIPRRFSIAEIKRIFGYPDDYQFPGSYQAAVGRLGNSVPPPLAKAVGDAMMRVLISNQIAEGT